MSAGGHRRVKLRGVLERTASTAEVRSDGALVVELYDFSPNAHAWFGNDVAFLLTVAAGEKDAMLSKLTAGRDVGPGSDADDLLLALIEERFSDYYAVKRWLEAHAIPFETEFDARA